MSQIVARLITKNFQSFGHNFSTSTSQNAIKNVTIIGGGLMGSGIAQVTAQAGINVNLVDVSSQALDKAKHGIQQSLQRIAKKQFKDDPNKAQDFVQKSSLLLNFTDKRDEVVAKSDLVIEAIIENIGIKQKLFSEIDKVAPENTIFATNTSSLPVGEIGANIKRKDRFGGLHFFSPVPMMKLLEVVRTTETSDKTFEEMCVWGKQIGKITVNCKDTPGFIVNRLLIPYTVEAMRMFERGDASAQDIDTAMKLGAGYPMGPLELTDFVGLDVSFFILSGWEKSYPDNPQFKVPETLKKMVAEGKLGRKSGEGFYKYSK